MNQDILNLYETEHNIEQKVGTGSKIRKKKKRKRSKRIENLLKKQNKYLKQLAKICKLKAENKQEKARKDYGEEKTCKEHADGEQEKDKQSKKSFWIKLGDAVIKAVPVILTRVTVAVCNFLFGRKYRNGSLQHGWSMG